MSGCDANDPGAIDLINDGRCRLDGRGETIIHVLWIIVIVFFSLLTTYTVCRFIGMLRLWCIHHQRTSPVPTPTNNVYMVNNNNNNNGIPAASTGGGLSHLRIPALLTLSLFLGSICSLITGILHLRGDRISVDVGISITSALAWYIFWLGGHAFLGVWIRLGAAWARGFMPLPPAAVEMLRYADWLQIGATLISSTMPIFFLVSINRSSHIQKICLIGVCSVLAVQSTLFCAALFSLGKRLQVFLQQAYDAQHAQQHANHGGGHPQPPPSLSHSDTPANGSNTTTANANGINGANGATTSRFRKHKRPVNPIVTALARIKLFMVYLRWIWIVPITAIVLAIFADYLMYLWPIFLISAATILTIMVYTMKTVNVATSSPVIAPAPSVHGGTRHQLPPHPSSQPAPTSAPPKMSPSYHRPMTNHTSNGIVEQPFLTTATTSPATINGHLSLAAGAGAAAAALTITNTATTATAPTSHNNYINNDVNHQHHPHHSHHDHHHDDGDSVSLHHLPAPTTITAAMVSTPPTIATQPPPSLVPPPLTMSDSSGAIIGVNQ